ncbi:MAG: hypothetical protein KDA25_05800 [Phycisphaerales bacterium]|nr:hypothetical protein [Phycisphaerales bacterium]
MAKKPARCEWTTLRQALAAFARNATGHQGQGHIRPLHWYVASRLVIEGGFLPEDVTPRPPLVARRQGHRIRLAFDVDRAGSGERVVLGGLKTKNVDVTVCKDGVGPVVAVSIKGTLQAFRNLTNRMEEAVGDCTNLHIAYPALVYGYLVVLRGNREHDDLPKNDCAILQGGQVVDSIRRYHDVLVRLAGRDDIRAEPSKYEAVALSLVLPEEPAVGTLFDGFPPPASVLSVTRFFETLYEQYDRRFVFAAPALEASTRRVEWSDDSPILSRDDVAEFCPRVCR